MNYAPSQIRDPRLHFVYLASINTGNMATVRNEFEGSEYRVVIGPSVRPALHELDHKFDLVILDDSAAQSGVVDFLARVRQETDAPIVAMVSERNACYRVALFEAGADDVITKPFERLELLARIRALVRRVSLNAIDAGGPFQNGERAERYAFGRLVVDIDKRELLTAEGDPIAVTSTEFDLLVLLMKKRGRVLSREMIMSELHGPNFSSSDRAVDVLVAKLRKKLSAANACDIIKTKRNVGYLFGSSVTRMAAELVA